MQCGWSVMLALLERVAAIWSTGLLEVVLNSVVTVVFVPSTAVPLCVNDSSIVDSVCFFKIKMTKQLSSDAIAYDKEYDAFIKQLEDFHQQRGTPFKKLPRINGKAIDLYLLYVVITARGGWQKVNSRNEWADLLEDFRLHPACVNSTIALKQVYVRFLDAYERINYLGEDGNEQNNDGDEDDSRAVRLRKSVRNLNNVPMVYNQQQHVVADTARVGAGLCTELHKASTYDRLALSLTCPLPNEHDFAFNMCTLLSNEGKHTLQLSECNRLVELMLAHTGVFKDKYTQKYFISNYKESRGKSLVQFWIDSVEDKSVLDLLSTDCTESIDLQKSARKPDELRDGDVVAKDASVLVEESTDSRNTDQRGVLLPETDKDPAGAVTKAVISSKLEEVLACEVVDLRLEPEDAEIFHLGRDLGLLDSEGTRISQVLHILRNLSFEEFNVLLLAQSNTCLRFLVLCICSRWGGLSIGALDTLGNIASEVALRDPAVDPASSLLLTTVCQGVSSQDRAFVLRCLEVLNKLSINEPNEEILSSNVDQTVFDQICRYLTVHDIMLLIFTLECLYSLSSLGEQTCNRIARSKGAIQTLISLLTVEAQSYGPEACIGMKVVETVTGVVSESEGGEEAAKAGTTTPTPGQQPNAPSGQVQTPINTPNPAQVHRLQGSSPLVATPKSNAKPIMDPKRLIATRVVPQEVEDFAVDWVKRNYEGCSNNAIEQAIVYRHFSAAMHAVGKKHGINPIFLSSCIKKVFGSAVGPLKRQVDGLEKWHYVGLRRRDRIVVPNIVNTPAGLNPNPTPIAAAVPAKVDSIASPAIQGSILKAHLSSPLKPMTPVARIGQQAYMRNAPPTGHSMVVDNKGWPNPTRASSTDNSALIKSLLASKVTTTVVDGLRPVDNRPAAQHHQEPPLNPSVGPPPIRPTVLPPMPLTKLVYSNQLMLSRQMQNQSGPVEVVRPDGSKVYAINGLSNEGIKMENESLPTSFEGILQNGLTKEADPVERFEEHPPSRKNLLADLLEKTVGEDILNGVVDKEIRLTDKTSKLAGFAKQNLCTVSEQPHGGVKRSAVSQDSPQSAKKLALDDAGKITLYVSQNGTEGEVLSQGHQVVLNQGHQLVSSAGMQGHQVVSTQTMVTPQGQVIIQRAIAHPNVVQSHQAMSKPSTPRISQQAPSVVHVTSAPTQPISSSSPQIISSNGQVLHQVIGHNQTGQKVILHGGQVGQVIGNQVILPQNNSQGIMVQGANNLSGQLIMQGVNNPNSVMVQGTNGQNQVILQGSQNQGQVFLQTSSGQGNQYVMSASNSHSQAPLVVNSSGQTMILANNQGQSVVVGGSQPGHQVVVGGSQPGHQVVVGGSQPGHQVVVGGSMQNHQGQVVVQGNTVGNAVFLAQHQQQSQSGQKTLIILPNPKMVVSGSQAQSGQVMLPRQVVQMVSGSTAPTMQTAAAAARTVKTPHTTAPLSIQVNTSALPKGPTATPVAISTTTGVSPSAQVATPQVIASGGGVVRRPSKGELQYVCEWRGCNQAFTTPGLVYHHACKVHCPSHLIEITCQWNGCEPMTRKRFSAMTHIHDRHCNEQLLQIHAMRRQQLTLSGKTEIPMPQTPPPHPGYAPNAAFHAIKRHSIEVINQRDVVEKEGPVTKSIRLTAALVLRNLVIYSHLGKELLVGYESELANVAISCMEASRTISQLLYYINTPTDS